MKAVFINNNISGIIIFRQDVIESFERDGYDISIIIPKYELKSEIYKRIPKSWHIYAADLDANSISPTKDYKYLKDLISIFKKVNPDIVMTYTVKPNIYGAIACGICRIPCISMMAGLGYLFSGNGIKQKIGQTLYKYALKNAKKIVVLNKQNYDRLLSMNFTDPSKLIWLESGEGVNLNKYPFVAKKYNSVSFIMIARLLYDKGYTEFVDAARIVKRQYPDVKFQILGGPDFTSKMGVPKEVLEKDKKEGVIELLGVIDDIPSYLNHQDTVITIPSKYLEGLNRSLIEACSAGCPIITTDIPGCRETVIDNINGFLIPPGDSKKLADAMIRMIQLSPDQRKQMSKQSHILAEQKFDVNNVISVYKSLVSKVLADKQS